MFEHASQKRYKTVKTDCFDWFVLYKKQLGSRVMFMIFCYCKRFCSTWKRVSHSLFVPLPPIASGLPITALDFSDHFPLLHHE